MRRVTFVARVALRLFSWFHGELVQRAHDAGKAVFVHLDLIEGLASREISADFVAKHTKADGVLFTKVAMTRRAKELGLVAI